MSHLGIRLEPGAGSYCRAGTERCIAYQLRYLAGATSCRRKASLASDRFLWRHFSASVRFAAKSGHLRRQPKQPPSTVAERDWRVADLAMERSGWRAVHQIAPPLEKMRCHQDCLQPTEGARGSSRRNILRWQH